MKDEAFRVSALLTKCHVLYHASRIRKMKIVQMLPSMLCSLHLSLTISIHLGKLPETWGLYRENTASCSGNSGFKL